MVDEVKVEDGPEPFVAKTVKREDIPVEVMPGNEDVPALNMPKPHRDDPKVTHAKPEKTKKSTVSKEAKAEVAKEFYDFLRERYGENDQLVKLFGKFSREKLVYDPRG